MAGEWLKVEHSTPDKTEVMRMARHLKVSTDDAFGKYFRMWRWFDKETVGGRAVGIGLEELDNYIGAKGFAACAVESGWLVVEGNDLVMPEFAKHCGEGAKTRGLTAWRVAKHANKANGGGVSTALPRTENERKKENSNRERPDRVQSPLENSSSEEEVGEPLDLSGVDWERVKLLADALSKRVPPYTPTDRRQWFKFAVLVEHGMFAEHWLLDSAEAVRTSKSHTKNRQAHLVAVLKSKAAEEGTDASTFRGILRRIEIPADVWKSDSIKVKK